MNPCILMFGMPPSSTIWIGKLPSGSNGLNGKSQTEEFTYVSTQAMSTDCHVAFMRPRGAARRWRAELTPQIIGHTHRILRSRSVAGFYPDDAQASQGLPEAAE